MLGGKFLTSRFGSPQTKPVIALKSVYFVQVCTPFVPHDLQTLINKGKLLFVLGSNHHKTTKYKTY